MLDFWTGLILTKSAKLLFDSASNFAKKSAFFGEEVASGLSLE